MMLRNLNDIVNSNLCLGCGLCLLNTNAENTPVKLEYSSLRGHQTPVNIDINSINSKNGFDICPGKGYKINSLALKYRLSSNFHLDIGYYDGLDTVRAIKREYETNASSSGIMTQIVDFLLKENMIDKAIVTKFIYTKEGPVAKAFITNKKEELMEAQGSKYCPVDFTDVLKNIMNSETEERFAFVGTPCQIAGIRNIQSEIKYIGVKYFIGNFCGGFKSYNNLQRLITMNKFKLKDVNYFRFRGGGQPGSMNINTISGDVCKIPYPEYVMMTGYSKLKRCHLCVDATAELADFSCGDAWLDEYVSSGIPTSIVITRNQEASSILNMMSEKMLIEKNSISIEKVIGSQKGNIATKKYRQFGRLKLYKMLSIKTPEIVEGYYKGNYSLKTEINVFISHRVKLIFEKLHLFKLFYYKKGILKKVMFRLFKGNYD